MSRHDVRACAARQRRAAGLDVPFVSPPLHSRCTPDSGALRGYTNIRPLRQSSSPPSRGYGPVRVPALSCHASVNPLLQNFSNPSRRCEKD